MPSLDGMAQSWCLWPCQAPCLPSSFGGDSEHFEGFGWRRRQDCFWWCGLRPRNCNKGSKSNVRGDGRVGNLAAHILNNTLLVHQLRSWGLFFGSAQHMWRSWLGYASYSQIGTRRARQQWPFSGEPRWTLTDRSFPTTCSLPMRVLFALPANVR